MALEYLFVYGTLRKRLPSGRFLLLASHAEFVGNGMVQGKLYEVEGYPGLVLSGNPKDQVAGEVLLTEPQAILERLDEYEGCSTIYPQPQEYKRVKGTIVLEEGRSVSAWIYLFNRPTAKLKQIISGDFLEFIQAKQV